VLPNSAATRPAASPVMVSVPGPVAATVAPACSSTVIACATLGRAQEDRPRTPLASRVATLVSAMTRPR
jgi:hypothetical protein